MKRLRLILIFLIGSGTVGFAQNSIDPNAKTILQPSTRKHYSPKRAKAVKSKKKNVKHTARYEFYKRVEIAARDKQRILKKLSKPQFSDPSYFGHKKKPKRRSSHRMKFCHECHIRH